MALLLREVLEVVTRINHRAAPPCPFGLDPPVPYQTADILRPLFGLPPYIPEGRATFEALIPNRFKPTTDEV